MKKLFAALIIGLTLFHPLAAQTISTEPQSDDRKSAELREANRLSAQAVELYNKNQFDEAMPLAQRALEIRERAVGRDSALVGEALQNLGSLYAAKKKYGDALSLYKRALAILEKSDGPDNAKLANTLDNLGWLHFADGNASKAEESFQRSLTIREKALGANHDNVARSLRALAEFYQATGDYKKAIDYYQRAMAVKEKALGPGHKDIGELAMKCACALLQNRQPREALSMRLRAYSILNKPEGSSERIIGSVIQGRATFRAEPEYPPAARRERVSGAVVVEVTVDENGKVIKARSLCGHDMLAPAAIEAARKWRFSPTQLNGQPVKVVSAIEFYFNL
jgi:TonB family protein